MSTKLHIIPSPKVVTPLSQKPECLEIEAKITLVHDEFSSAVNAFLDMAKKIHSIDFAKGSGINVKLDTSLSPSEYTITAGTPTEICAADIDGINCAFATLLQIMTVSDGKIALPSVKIQDKPDSSYRTLMVDLARKWHPFDTLLRYVDLCYLYKIKFLHLHFIDIQSYTLPSEKFPKMPTEDRHYTKEEIAYLNEYALSKNIEIIPEMEVPGHAKAMVCAYPELFLNTPNGETTQDNYSLFFSEIKSNIICVGKPGIMDTLHTLTEEIISMFPYSRYLHIGGDEAAIGDWGSCRDCTEYMKKNGIDGVRPLYTHFVKKMTDMVLDMGKTPIVWEGFPREGSEQISRKVIVTAWESYYHLAPELIEEGFTITNASWQPLYTVPQGHRVVTTGRWTPEEVLDWNLYTWRNWNKKTAAYEKPIVVEPTEQVIGATFCAWENDYDGEIVPIRENLAAMSEKVWNINSTVTHEDFMESLSHLLKLAEKIT